MNQYRVLCVLHVRSVDGSDPFKLLANSSLIQHTHSFWVGGAEDPSPLPSVHSKHQTLIHPDQRSYLKGERPLETYDWPDYQLSGVLTTLNPIFQCEAVAYCSLGRCKKGETTILLSWATTQILPLPTVPTSISPHRTRYQTIFKWCGCLYCGYADWSCLSALMCIDSELLCNTAPHPLTDKTLQLPQLHLPAYTHFQCIWAHQLYQPLLNYLCLC